jgi:hypothetical protein
MAELDSGRIVETEIETGTIAVLLVSRPVPHAAVKAAVNVGERRDALLYLT